MAWVGTKTVVAGDPLLIEDHNTYVNTNLLYLLSPNRIYVKNTSATDFTTTSSTYVAVDATLSASLTTYGGHIKIGATFNCDTTAGTITFAFDVDGTQHLQWNPNTNPIIGSPDYRGRNLMELFLPSSVIAAGAHTIALKWKVSGGGTATIYNDALNTFFWAVEG